MSDGETPQTGKAAKRARKKAFRDEQRAAYMVALRRRRNIRLGIGAVLIAALIVAGLVATGGNEEPEPTPAADQASPSPQETPVQSAYAEGSIPAVTDKNTPGCPREAQPPGPAPDGYSSVPRPSLKPDADYVAIVTTSCGELTIDLAEGKAPANVNNFIFLAQEGFFNGLIWHRVERNAVIQTGDPNGLNGIEPDGPGYSVPDELPAERKEYVYGVVGMANSGPNSGGSQWFIVTHKGPKGELNEPAGYDPLYSIVGKVEKSSYKVLDQLDKQPTIGGSDPIRSVMPIIPLYVLDVQIFER